MTQRLRRVSPNSKEPSVRILENISHNVRVKTGESCHVEISSWSFGTGKEETTFLFYQPSCKVTIAFSSWDLFLDHYQKVMAEGGA